MLHKILVIINWIIAFVAIFLYVKGNHKQQKAIEKFSVLYAKSFVICYILYMLLVGMVYHSTIFSPEFSQITDFLQTSSIIIFIVLYLIYRHTKLLIIKIKNNIKKHNKLNFEHEYLLDLILSKLFEIKFQGIEKNKIPQYCAYKISQDMQSVNATFLHRDDTMDTLIYIVSRRYSISLDQLKRLIISLIPKANIEYNTIMLGASKEALEKYKNLYVLSIIDIFCYMFISNNINNKKLWDELGLYDPWEESQDSYNIYLRKLNDITQKRIKYFNDCKKIGIHDTYTILESIEKEIPFKTTIERVWYSKERRKQNIDSD